MPGRRTARALRLVERFSLLPGDEVLEYQVTADDPKTLAQAGELYAVLPAFAHRPAGIVLRKPMSGQTANAGPVAGHSANGRSTAISQARGHLLSRRHHHRVVRLLPLRRRGGDGLSAEVLPGLGSVRRRHCCRSRPSSSASSRGRSAPRCSATTAIASAARRCWSSR